jgi:undecaprenyl phosphate-alpha-L-ara4N flippase subunit ArnE
MFWKMGANGNWLILLAGFALYGIGALLMMVAYRFGNLSVLHPMLSMNYIFTIMIARFILGEDITLIKLAGTLIIIFGVVMIGGGDN